jgi:hypothetical protein
MAVADVAARYEAAAAVTVEHYTVAWPAMRDAVRRVRKVRQRAVDGGASLALEDLADEIAGWIRVIAAGPVSATDMNVGAGRLASDVRRHVAGGLDSALTTELAGLAGMLDALAAGPHPGGPCLEAILSRYGRDRPDDAPAVYLAAAGRDVEHLQRWLEAEELDAEVCGVSHLRGAPVRQAVVLIGPPSRYFVSAWCPPARAARLSGWLLTAPPARHVYVVTWPGHAALDAGASPLFPETPAPVVSAVVFGTGSAAPADDQDLVWLPPVPVDARIRPRPEWTGHPDPVAAVGFQVGGDSIAFFPPAGDPAPELVTWEHNSVHVGLVDAAEVTAGSVVLFRPSRAGGDPELYRRADELVAERLGPDAPAAAHAAKAELKAALQLARERHDEEYLHYELKARLNNSTYARHILHSVPLASYIAPERLGAYDAVRHVLRLPVDSDGRKNRLLSALRSGCRRAGADITNELIDVLRATTGWQEDLETSGVAQVSTAGFGGLELRVVTAVDPDRHRVGRSRLGRLLAAVADQ